MEMGFTAAASGFIPSMGFFVARTARSFAKIPFLGRLLPSHLTLGRRDLRTSLRYSDIGPHGPLITGLFTRLQEIRGSFNIDDCSHFHLVLSLQSALGIQGDFLEIGSYGGRSAAMMARYLAEGEAIHICDAFRLLAGRDKATPAELLTNVLSVSPSLASDRIIIYECLSADLSLDAQLKLRFVHIDGGHSTEQTLLDLNLAKNHVIEKGVIAVDDYHHRAWPGVSQAVDAFLRDNAGFFVLGDLNRHGAKGRKVYLMKRSPRA